jgi:hypothetical protein
MEGSQMTQQNPVQTSAHPSESERVQPASPAAGAVEVRGTSAELACTKAFTDDKGNRFIYPSMIRWPQDEEYDRPAKHDLILRAMSLDLALRTTADEGWFEFDPDNFPHVTTQIGHRHFAHGSATVILFAGPEFDAAMAERP